MLSANIDENILEEMKQKDAGLYYEMQESLINNDSKTEEDIELEQIKQYQNRYQKATSTPVTTIPTNPNKTDSGMVNDDNRQEEITTQKKKNKFIQEEHQQVQSLGKAPGWEDKQKDRSEYRNLANNIDWKNLPLENLPSKGLFYPIDSQMAIKAATVKEIRHFSTIDDTDSIDTEEKLNFILERLVKFRTVDEIISWKHIKEVDKLYILFAIREYTFIDGENQLSIKHTCNNCKYENSFTLKKEHFQYFSLDPRIEKYYNSSLRSLDVKMKNGDSIELTLPSIGVNQFNISYVRNKLKTNSQYDKAFFKMSPYLFGDWRVLNENTYMDKLFETMEWNYKKLSVVQGLVDVIKSSINPTMKEKCEQCGAEVSARLRFPRGFRDLFLISDIFSELL